MNNFDDLIKDLKKNSDEKYRDFSSGLSGVSEIKIMGVRIPDLRKIVKEYKDLDLNTFKLDKTYELMFTYFAIALMQSKDFEAGIAAILAKEEYWIGWNLTDPVFGYLKFPKNFKEVIPIVKKLKKHKNPYVRRLAFLILFKYCKIRDNFTEITNLLENDDNYYVQMVESWLICELYIHAPNETFTYLKTCKLDKIIVNKAVSKINDSYRVNKEQKEKAKTLRK